MSASADLVLSGVHVSHGSLPAVIDATVQVRAGTMTCIVGPNGAGKSSLVGAIGGWYRVERGGIRLGAADVTRQSIHGRARAGLAVVPETALLFPLLSVEETIRLSLRHGRPSQWSEKRLFEVFPRLEERRRSRTANLSGGERQMLAIARALAVGPSHIVLDEPSAGLAPIICHQVADTLNLLVSEGLGVCLFEQSLTIAERVAPHAVSMNRGRLIGEVDIRREAELVRKAYFGQGEK